MPRHVLVKAIKPAVCSCTALPLARRCYIFYRVTYFHNELGITRLIYGTTPPPFLLGYCEPHVIPYGWKKLDRRTDVCYQFFYYYHFEQLIRKIDTYFFSVQFTFKMIFWKILSFHISTVLTVFSRAWIGRDDSSDKQVSETIQRNETNLSLVVYLDI